MIFQFHIARCHGRNGNLHEKNMRYKRSRMTPGRLKSSGGLASTVLTGIARLFFDLSQHLLGNFLVEECEK